MRSLIVICFYGVVLADRATLSEVFRKIDQDHDGRISSKEYITLVTHLDHNGNGVISNTEFISSFVANGAGTEEEASRVFYAVDANSTEQWNADDQATLKSFFDANGDGFVSTDEFKASLSNLAAEHALEAAAQDKLEAIFSSADRDHSALLTIPEFAVYFGNSDGNDDKKVTFDEFKTFWMKQTGESEERIRVLFSMVDADSNGVIDSNAEKLQAFVQFDKNGDGVIEKQEFLGFFQGEEENLGVLLE